MPSLMLIADTITRAMEILSAVETVDFDSLARMPRQPENICKAILLLLELERENFDEGATGCDTFLEAGKVIPSFLLLARHINQQKWKGAEIFAQICCILAQGIYALTSPGTVSAGKLSELVAAMLAAKFPEVGIGIGNQWAQSCPVFQNL